MYIVLYSKDKNVNAKPLAQIRLPISEFKDEKRFKKWVSLEGKVEVNLDCCYAPCILFSSSSMRLS